MRKTMIMGSVLVVALAVATGVMACDKANAAAQAAYTKAIGEGSCAKTAEKAASVRTCCKDNELMAGVEQVASQLAGQRPPESPRRWGGTESK